MTHRATNALPQSMSLDNDADQVSIWSLPYLEELYRDYIRDEGSVAPDWRQLFKSVDGNGAAPRPPAFRRESPRNESAKAREAGGESSHRLAELVRAYRTWGHLEASLDPLGFPRSPRAELDPRHYGLDLQTPIPTATREIFPDGRLRTVGDLLSRLRQLYCGSIGYDFLHIDDSEIREWLRAAIEETAIEPELQPARALELLVQAESFDAFVRKKYVGAKSFSLEGSEALIPLLEAAIDHAAREGALEVVLSMAHRGRLNVLVNVIGKRPRDVFREFHDEHAEDFHGDVKYHLGASSDRVTASGQKVHLSLCFNPSHLEYINPVLCGRVRAKQDRVDDRARYRAVGIQIHGDAAFAGEGVVTETLTISPLEAYHTGGSLHIVVNNQIGFTTAPDEGRAGEYTTDIAKGLQIPIFHVNGDDIPAVLRIGRLAMDFRAKFARDVIIDLYGYRRFGHNEGDEPSYTQPHLYQAIEQHRSVPQLYADSLTREQKSSVENLEQLTKSAVAHLEAELNAARSMTDDPAPGVDRGPWATYSAGPIVQAKPVATRVAEARMKAILKRIAEVPPGFNLHPRLTKLMERRAEMSRGSRPIDWATAETLAFGTLALEGTRVRMSGQDTERGTFSHRHAVLHDVQGPGSYEPLNHLAESQARVEIYNSPLSEIGVLSFEYGYSLDAPEVLVLWEAQFGDFVNAAQVLIDQFLTSAEAKWRRLSGIVLLLPHGFDGQGPEHSSARLERFLLLAVEDNIQVVNLTTPAQYFHVLRRQALSQWRKPLIIMTPKSLLRHPLAVSELSQFSAGQFEPLMLDSHATKNPTRVLLCSGKIYYEVLERREKSKRQDVAIVRLEQLYPLPLDPLAAYFSKLKKGTEVTWVQEEPENMGAWLFIRQHLSALVSPRHKFAAIARPSSATPATGSPKRHKAEQAEILDQAIE